MIGTKLAHYEISSHLGSGGMGDVYQATDSKLGRSVAIKFLPEAFSHDSERVARFEREARVLAALNHSNIAVIHGLEESGGRKFLVMELVGGETLAERIKRGQIPVDEALQIGKQICEALETAHEKGIIHRDLKPANVKITPDGKVKVLDFGLAKALPKATNANFSNSPTLSMGATTAGVILGTAAYMSPEQARGEDTDERSDIFSFGCVLYEMLTGQPAFQGKTVSDILAGVLKVEPDFTLLPPNLNPRLHELLRRCFDKNVRRRWHTIADLKIDLETIASTPRVKPDITPHELTASRSRERFVWISAVGILALTALTIGVMSFRSAPAVSEVRFEINTPSTQSPGSFALSPDGKKIVFVANSSDGRTVLFLRPLDSVEARPLTGTEGAASPFWSADNRSVAFYADGKLKRIDIDGGPAQSLASAVQGSAGSWKRDGTILFTPGGSNNPVLRVPATGGAAVAMTRVDPSYRNQFNPQFLPDGHHFLYRITTTSPETSGIYIGDLDGPDTRFLVQGLLGFRFVSPGHAFFLRDRALMAQEFDADRMEMKGNPFVVADRVAVFSTSEAGSIAYRNFSGPLLRQPVWLDRSGKAVQKVGDPVVALNIGSTLSPDGRRIALSRFNDGNADLWLLDVDKGVPSRFTFDSAIDQNPVWSPDGSRIVWESPRKGTYDLYIKSATKVSVDEVLFASAELKSPLDWSADGRFILYRNLDLKTGFDLWALPMDGDRKPFPVVRTNADERTAQFSPDGKWIAYQSDESGHFEIYVQPFPGPAGKFQISTKGGAQMRWRRDGKELFYIDLDDQLMAAPIQFASDGQSVQAGTPVQLFTTHVGGAVQQNPAVLRQYEVSPDGQRFLMNTVVDGPAPPINIILNWHPERAGK
jgi:eukaryotic-like serine/threonine-protein kinase